MTTRGNPVTHVKVLQMMLDDPDIDGDKYAAISAAIAALSPAPERVDVGHVIAACTAYNNYLGRGDRKRTADPKAMRAALTAAMRNEHE